MAKIIDFNTAKKKIGSTPHGENQQTQEEVRKYILGIDDGDGEEDLHVQMTFLNLDETRTAIVGDFAAVEPLIDELQGDVQRRQRIYDDERKNRGPGIILSVQQVVQLLKMMLDMGGPTSILTFTSLQKLATKHSKREIKRLFANPRNNGLWKRSQYYLPIKYIGQSSHPQPERL